MRPDRRRSRPNTASAARSPAAARRVRRTPAAVAADAAVNIPPSLRSPVNIPPSLRSPVNIPPSLRSPVNIPPSLRSPEGSYDHVRVGQPGPPELEQHQVELDQNQDRAADRRRPIQLDPAGRR